MAMLLKDYEKGLESTAGLVREYAVSIPGLLQGSFKVERLLENNSTTQRIQ
jgi:hypothetical protein